MKRMRDNHGVAFRAHVVFSARIEDSAGSAPLRRALTYDQGQEMCDTAFSRSRRMTCPGKLGPG
jgi:hypothetical protein